MGRGAEPIGSEPGRSLCVVLPKEVYELVREEQRRQGTKRPGKVVSEWLARSPAEAETLRLVRPLLAGPGGLGRVKALLEGSAPNEPRGGRGRGKVEELRKMISEAGTHTWKSSATFGKVCEVCGKPAKTAGPTCGGGLRSE